MDLGGSFDFTGKVAASLGGDALIAAARIAGPDTRMPVSLIVSSMVVQVVERAQPLKTCSVSLLRELKKERRAPT
jgi:hypothetical protein